MKTDAPWQRIAERLTEVGWSWNQCERIDQKRDVVHLVEAHNMDGELHVVVAGSMNEAFVALKDSIKAVQ